MSLTGRSLIGGRETSGDSRSFHAFDPVRGAPLEPAFYEAELADVDHAMTMACRAAEDYRLRSWTEIADFLESIAAGISQLGDELLERAQQETGLSRDRLSGERDRTTGQLRLFASVVREGSWRDIRIDRAQPDRLPQPRPDLRRMLIPIGPVVVFGASNFPLAFSVAGGDTASALAAGNPVVVKGHPSHPGTSEMVASAIQRAVKAAGLAPGVFALLQGESTEVGLALVRHPFTAAVGFTGSLKGGRALYNAAAARPQPIPVFAEMGSINPVFLLPEAVKQRTGAIAAGLQRTITLGSGQFCTNPGVVVGMQGPDLQGLSGILAEMIAETPPCSMLSPALHRAFQEGAERVRSIAGVSVLGSAQPRAGNSGAEATAQLLGVDASVFLNEPRLHEELFGPSSILVTCHSAAELEAVARHLQGQLTATIHGTAQDLARCAGLVQILQQKVGRLIFNGYPTGVEVSHATHHGGPYPATTDVRSTSVGSAAIERFARPICFQDFPQEALPIELRDANEQGIWRMIDGIISRDPV